MEREKPSEPWTNEKHSHYLDAIEASFVRNMLEDRNARRSPRLDLYMPDSSDSTQDSPSRARSKYQSSPSAKSKMDAKDDKRWRRRATNSSDSSSSSSALDQISTPERSSRTDGLSLVSRSTGIDSFEFWMTGGPPDELQGR